MASTDSLDQGDCDSDASNESTLSEGAISRTKKISPKFASEPNLSLLDARLNEETPKNAKKLGSRLFRSKALSASHNLNKRYQKRAAIRATPTSCVSCFEEQDTVSENESLCREGNRTPEMTPKKIAPDSDQEMQSPVKFHYLTSTPGVSEAVFDEGSSTPYTVNFRRASMSPITKSTQKLSKAMQVCLLLRFSLCIVHLWHVLSLRLIYHRFC